jgi:hypothetical protein
VIEANYLAYMAAQNAAAVIVKQIGKYPGLPDLPIKGPVKIAK